MFADMFIVDTVVQPSRVLNTMFFSLRDGGDCSALMQKDGIDSSIEDAKNRLSKVEAQIAAEDRPRAALAPQARFALCVLQVSDFPKN